MKKEFEYYLVETNGLTHKAADCNGLKALAEAKGYGKLVKKLGSCWANKWIIDNNGVELKNYIMYIDKLPLKKGVYFEMVIKIYK